MPSLDMSLAVCVVRSGQLPAALDAGITSDHLFDEGRIVFGYAKGFFTKFGKIPDAATVEQDTKIKVPDLSEVTEPVAYYIDRIKARALDRLAVDQVKKMVAAADKVDTKSVVAGATELITEISKRNLAGEPIADWTNVGNRWNEYQTVKNTPAGLTGIPTHWPSVNDITQGINKGDFWIIVARPGCGKTWSLVKLTLEVWLQEYHPLFISLEMPRPKIERRLDACYARVNYHDFKRGRLGDLVPGLGDFQYKAALDSLKGKSPLSIVTRKRVKTVSDVAVLIEQLKPDVVMIDGLYKLRPSGKNAYKSNWEKIMDLADEIQELCQEKECPIVGTTQFARTQVKSGGKGSAVKAGIEHLAFADAIGMNADVILALFSTEELKANGEHIIRLLKNREDDIGAWTAKFDLTSMDFTETGKYEDAADSGGDDASVDFSP